MKLGRQELKRIGPVDRPTIIYDEDLKGFGLRLMPPSSRNPAGARAWIVEYRPGAGGRNVSKRRLVIGRPETLPPERARQQAKDLLAEARLGADPANDRARSRKARPLSVLGPLYLAATNPHRKPRTRELYEGLWRNHILPEIGSNKPADLSRRQIEKLHREIGERHPSTANRVVILLSHFFSWAEREGDAPDAHNPARGITKFRETRRERFLSVGEFGRLMDSQYSACSSPAPPQCDDQSHSPERSRP